MNLLDVDSRFEGARVVGPLVLNLGAGIVPIKGAVNQDGAPREGIDIVFDLLDVPWPIPTASFHKVVSFHCMEHIPISKILGPLFEIHRVLVPGGMVILELPDFKKCFDAYTAGDIGMLDVIYGARSTHEFDSHKWAYSPESISTLLWSVGFEKLWCGPGRDYHSTQIPTFRIESCRNAIIV